MAKSCMVLRMIALKVDDNRMDDHVVGVCHSVVAEKVGGYELVWGRLLLYRSGTMVPKLTSDQ